MELINTRGAKPSGSTNGYRIGWKISGYTLFVILAIFIVYLSVIDIKGVWTDETLRLGVMNGGQQFTSDGVGTSADLEAVARQIAFYPHQPLYFLLQNVVMRITQSHDAVVLRMVNVIFLFAGLVGILAFVKRWRPIPQIVALSVFAFNSYLMMHVMQIREYTLGITVMIWTSYFALRLFRLDLRSIPTALPWFVGYGLLLCIGFFNQSWIVLAAVPQGLFLLSRSEQRFRFYTLMIVPYAIVGVTTIPYVLEHQNKMNVGQWDIENTADRLWSGLLNGYHLVLGGAPADASLFINGLAAFWGGVIALGIGVLMVPRLRPVIQRAEPQTVAITALAGLTCLFMLSFQVVYFFKVDALSVWPRYFAIYYFYLMILIALAFNSLYSLASDWGLIGLGKVSSQAMTLIVMVMTVVSAVGQTYNYRRDPYYDTGMTKTCNWVQLTNRLNAAVARDDTILAHDFLFASTLTYVRPFANRVISLTDVQAGKVELGARVAYLNMYLPTMLDSMRASLEQRGMRPERTVELSSPDWWECSSLWRRVELLYWERR